MVITYFLSIAAAIVMALAFPDPGWGGLVFVGLPLFFLALKRCQSQAGRFGISWLFGTIFMLIFHRWMFTLGHWAPAQFVGLLWVAFSAYLGLFYGGIGLAYGALKNHVPDWLSLPALWLLFETLKALGPIGNPAGSLGYALIDLPYLAQYASIVNVFGVSAIACLLVTLFLQKKWPAAIAFSVLVLLGGHALYTQALPQSAVMSIGVLQGNHEQAHKLNSAYYPYIRQTYLTLSQQGITESLDLLVWPEIVTAALNTNKLPFMSRLKNRLKGSNTGIVFGTPTKRSGLYYNSAVLMKGQGLSSTQYDKQKLMPFGEYWPFKSVLSKIGLKKWAAGSGYTPGETQPLLRHQEAKIGVAICLESLYPWASRKQVNNGATLLLALVNNAWFFESPAAMQHLQMTRLRAIETGRYVAQSSNTGYSAIINPKGDLILSSVLNTRTLLSHPVTLHTHKTPYMRFGDWLAGIALLICGYGLYLRIRAK